MTKRTGWLIGGAVLAAVLWGAGIIQAAAENAAPVTLKVYDHGGGFEITQTFAPRLATLNDKTVCEVSDATWEADRTFPLIADMLKRQFPAVRFISWDQFPTGVFGMDVDNIGELVKAKGCQAVIAGNAG